MSEPSRLFSAHRGRASARDAPRSFFDHGFDRWDVCADAWRRVLDFIDRHGVGGPDGG
jgi:hypothetical protein